jgi:transcription antitermination factor NusG
MFAERNEPEVRAREIGFSIVPAFITLTTGERWYVTRTLPNRENLAATNLQRMGFRIFAPRFRRIVRHARKTRSVLAPLFPSYVFVILNLTKDRWRSVNGAAGVASLVMGAELPIPVPHGVVEALRERGDSLEPISSGPPFKIGQKVRILSGPFAETLCQLDYLDERGRVRVLLEIMGGKVAAHLDRSVLAPAD